MHPSLEQAAHDSPKLPVSIRDDGEGVFSVLHYTLSPDG